MLRLNHVRLRGCGFTLFPAAKDFGVPEDVMHNILTSINDQLGSLDDIEATQAIRMENPEFPQVLKGNDYWLTAECIKKALDTNLLIEVPGGYELTDKAIKVFERAAAIQNKLDDEGFCYCPCHYF